MDSARNLARRRPPICLEWMQSSLVSLLRFSFWEAISKCRKTDLNFRILSRGLAVFSRGLYVSVWRAFWRNQTKSAPFFPRAESMYRASHPINKHSFSLRDARGTRKGARDANKGALSTLLRAVGVAKGVHYVSPPLSLSRKVHFRLFHLAR